MAAKKNATKSSKSKEIIPEITVGLKLRMDEDEYTVYEKARVVGSRALQLSQGAKPLIELTEKQLDAIAYNPIEIAKLEFDAGVVPLTVKRTLPHEKGNTSPKN